MKPNNFILNGFDRSGTSAISRTLASHPDIEIIMQPFNSGNIRQRLYQVLDDNNTTDSDYSFFKKLEQGTLETSYIRSDWHYNYSSVKEFVDKKLHLIKTTQNHLTIAWVKRHFPGIEHWGIWRDPMDILASLVRNNFHIQWYSGAVTELIETVKNNELLEPHFSKFIELLNNPIREMAFIIAVRSWFYFYYLESNKIIYYSEFAKNNTNALNPILHYFYLAAFDFNNSNKKDLNIIGQKYQAGTRYLDYIPKTDLESCAKIFRPLETLVLENNYDKRV